jgi:hypothetical protein
MPTDKQKFVLYVESPNDEHVFYNLLEHYQVPEVFVVKPKDGISDILKTLRAELLKQDDDRLQRVGMVVDADEDIDARWQELRRILERNGYQNLPDRPAAAGTLIVQEGRPTIGVWIMPDNTLPGELEHFIEFLIPERDANVLWQHARGVVDALPEQHFIEQDKMKAYVHSWLAWQARPGTPMGLAIGMKFLDANVPEAALLMQWVRRLFSANQ